MKNAIAWFFYLLGVIFFLLILAGVYIYVADPFGLNALLTVPAMPTIEEKVAPREKFTPDTSTVQDVPADKHPALTPTQERVLETVGIDPSTLPASVTDTQKQCLINAVGEARANEIKAGALPTVSELVRAQACL